MRTDSRPELKARRKLVWALLFISLLAANARAARRSSLKEIGREVAEKLHKSKGNRSLYVSLLLWKGKHPRFRAQRFLTDQLDAAIASSAKGWNVWRPQDLSETLRSRGLFPIDAYSINGFQIMSLVDVETLLRGFIEEKSGHVVVHLELWDLYPRWSIGTIRAEIPESAELLKLLGQKDRPIYDQQARAFLPGIGGITVPRCKHCPRPSIPLTEAERMTFAAITVAYTVEADGSVADAGFLTDFTAVGQDLQQTDVQSALRAVRAWRFEPAKDAAGRAVPVRESHLVPFRIPSP